MRGGGDFFVWFAGIVNGVVLFAFVAWFLLDDSSAWLEAAPRRPVEPDTVILMVGYLAMNFAASMIARSQPHGNET